MYFAQADGCRLWDLDGKPYFDLCSSHGATLIGHGDERIRQAVERVLDRGAACSYEHELHTELAELLCATIPCLERVRYAGSGTEATMHCLRLARAFTGRNKILKFEGHFHGYHDQVMVGIGTPVDQMGPEESPTKYRGSAGMTPGIEEHIVLVPFHRLDLLEQALAQHGDELAAVICEPIHFNAGCIIPSREYMQALRRMTQERGIVLIFDEVLSAFRMGPGGAQAYLQVIPDLCTIGKAVGGGYPLSVFGGRAEIMRRLMPQGDCQHSGTYVGHPVLVAAGLAAVEIYRQPGFYDHIRAVGERLVGGMNRSFQQHGVPGRVEGLGARFGVYFGVTGPIRNYRDVVRHDRAKMLEFIAAAIGEGVYFHDYGGGPCHHGYCHAMSVEDADEVVQRLDRAIGSMGSAG
jgi:glutamate-1-semialdehyde 2,1-aminomutase